MHKNNLKPTKNDFWFLPLGGTGEIGMNLNLYGHDDAWLMVDCGSTFRVPLDADQDNEPDAKLQDVVIPNASFIIHHKERLKGIVITHAHEDHIGALVHIWPHLQVPIYTTQYTAEIIQHKFFESVGLFNLPLVLLSSGEVIDIGPFHVRWLPITHSIPETHALLIATPCAKVLHTADWKIDPDPVVGNRFRPARFKKLGHEKIQAVVCDSTNALKEEAVPSELACQQGLLNIIEGLEGKVIVTLFASNLARLISLTRIAIETDRSIALFGRTLENVVRNARKMGLWPDNLPLIPPRDIGYFPDNKILIIATGCQGEPRAALARLAADRHPLCALKAGDSVIFSSMVIPGNEAYVERVIQQLQERDIQCITRDACDQIIHVSGHANRDDLKKMYQWVRPECVIPTHGEQIHMNANAELAQASGISTQLVGRNGDLFVIAPTYDRIQGAVTTGRIAIEDS